MNDDNAPKAWSYLGVAIYDPTRRPERNPTQKFWVRVKYFGFGSGSDWVVSTQTS